jgi:hypothetical protein
MENPNFLKQKYNLHQSEEVASAASRTETRTGDQVSHNPNTRIQNYLDRLSNLINPSELEGHPDFDRKERNLEMLKGSLHKKFVIKTEEISEGYFENQRRIAREQGHGDIEITEEMRKQLAEVIIADQESTLDNWIDYLASDDATYPDWLKYYAVRSILGMGAFDKETKEFAKRSKGTTKPFPDINREALAYVLDAIEKKQAGIKTVSPINIETDEAEYKKFEELLAGENFAKLYAFAIEKVTPASVEQLTITEGKWIKYEQGSDHMPLVESLQGHGTGWCTAGESTAEAQLANGDFYVYYSLDQSGNPTIPRAAIRMQENSIGEVRGVAEQQNLDPYIGDIVQEKMKEFPDGAMYEKKSADMKFLTAIETKTKNGEDLNKDDLVFLYETNASIEGFGYQRDPRIAELRATRNPEHDMPIVFGCTPEQIARNMNEVTENTKAYVGKLETGIFQKLPENLKHIYTSFPDRKIRIEDLGEAESKTGEEWITELEQAGIHISDYAKSMLKNPDFIESKNTENSTLVRLTVADLGFTGNATTDQLYERAELLGLELCPAEVGPQYRLKYQNQPMNEWLRIAMKQINDSDGHPNVFFLERDGDGLWLFRTWAESGLEWYPNYTFVCRLRKYET